MIHLSKALAAATDLHASAVLRRQIATALQDSATRADLCAQAEIRGQLACEAADAGLRTADDVYTLALLRDDVAACARALNVHMIACIRAGAPVDHLVLAALEQLRLDAARVDATVCLKQLRAIVVGTPVPAELRGPREPYPPWWRDLVDPLMSPAAPSRPSHRRPPG